MTELRKESEAKAYSDNLYEVVFQPITERSEYQTEPIKTKLAELKMAMGEEYFNKYIESLIKITYTETVLWMITGREINRTIIEGKYLPLIKEVFGVSSIRIFSQP